MMKVGISQNKELNIRVLLLPFVLFTILFGIQSSLTYAGNKTTATNMINGSGSIENLGVIKSEASKDAKVEIDNPQYSAQQKVDGEDAVYTAVDIMPEFPGGDFGLRKFIAKAIKYPNIAVEKSIQGRVFVKYTINKDGSVSDAKIARGVDPSIDKEAIRVIMSLPKWKPGMQNGKAVRVSLMVPITFQLM